MPDKAVRLPCPSCGERLEVYDDMTVFACGNCGSEARVERRGGAVMLRSDPEVARSVQAGTDETPTDRKDGRRVISVWILAACAVGLIVWIYVNKVNTPRAESKLKLTEVRQRAARAQISVFMIALAIYKLDTGLFPTTDQGLQALRVKPEGVKSWQGPYLPQEIPTDPWGRAYLYKFPGEHGAGPDVISYGTDGWPGGEGINADIVSWNSESGTTDSGGTRQGSGQASRSQETPEYTRTVRQESFCALTKDAFDELNRVAAQKDATGLALMVANGKVVLLQAGTKVWLTDPGIFQSQVRVDSSVHSVTQCWISNELLSK